ncbi:MAG: HEAT repeat domain-containing protein [Spirochaetota bacterium]
MLFWIAAGGTLRGGESFHEQVLLYGTDRDIAEAFSGQAEDLGDPVNRLVIEAFSRERGPHAYLGLVRYLGEVRLQDAHQVLVTELGRTTGDDYLEEVIGALGMLRNPASLGPLEELYRGEKLSSRVKKAVISAWGEIGDSRIQDTLEEIVRDLREPVEVRAAAVLALGSAGNEKALPRLEKIARNGYEPKLLRMYAVHSLGAVGGEGVLDVLGDLLRDGTHEVAEYAVRSIARIESGKTGELLIEALKSDFDTVRYYGARALGEMGHAPAVSILQFKARYDSNVTVRREAERALSRIQDDVQDDEANHGVYQ